MMEDPLKYEYERMIDKRIAALKQIDSMFDSAHSTCPFCCYAQNECMQCDIGEDTCNEYIDHKNKVMWSVDKMIEILEEVRKRIAQGGGVR